MRRGCRPPALPAGSPASATLVSSTRALCGLDFILQPPVRFPIEPHNVKPSATIRQRNKPRRRFLEADRTLAEGAAVHKIEVRVPTEQRRIITSRRRPEAPEGRIERKSSGDALTSTRRDEFAGIRPWAKRMSYRAVTARRVRGDARVTLNGGARRQKVQVRAKVSPHGARPTGRSRRSPARATPLSRLANLARWLFTFWTCSGSRSSR